MTEFRPGRFQILPPIVKNLIIINSLLALLQFVILKFGIDLSDHLGLHYWRSTLYRPWQLVTHMFMHGSPYDVNLTVMHLFSNMFALWMFGSILENLWGSKRFIIFYLICGLGAAFLHLGVLHLEFSQVEKSFQLFQNNPTLDQFMQFIKQRVTGGVRNPDEVNRILFQWQNDPGSQRLSNQAVQWAYEYLHGYRAGGQHVHGFFDQATVGASGAVFGVLFAFGYLFPNTLLYIYFLVPIKAKYVVAAYALFELFAGVKNSAGDQVAHFAHLGGMLVAFIILKFWSRNERRNFY